MSVWIVEGGTLEGLKRLISWLFFVSGRQTDCDASGLLFMWRPATMESKTEARSPRLRPTGSKTVPKLHQFPLGPTLTTQEPRKMSNLCERATSTENKRLI